MRGKRLLSATALTAAALLIGSVAAAPPVAAQDISSLRGKSPKLPDFGDIVVNRSALRVLGKALFWDASVGSDGFACASCHFHAGADIRIGNQFNPGGTEKTGNVYENGHDSNLTDPVLIEGFFPLFKLNDAVEVGIEDEDLFDEEALRNPDNVERDDDDRFSSNGTFNGNFVSGQDVEAAILVENFEDECTINPGEFHPNFRFDNGTPGDELDDLAFRKVEPRQTPSVINAVFNFRQFWDGRANNIFNGVDPFGQRTNDSGIGGVFKLDGGEVVRETLAIRNASLASQAVGPVLSDFEMSCNGRPFAFVGRKILAQRVLQKQAVDPRDSVFRASGLIGSDPTGLDANYAELVQAAFNPDYWDDDRLFVVDRDYENQVLTRINDGEPGFAAAQAAGLDFTLIEHNFQLFWGLALHEYQASLISDASNFDRNRLSASARRGKDIFEDKGKCVACHKGALFSGAAITSDEGDPLIEGMILASETANDEDPGESFNALYDEAFYNIGVSPAVEDLGVGGVDPFNNPLSFARQAVGSRPQNLVDSIILDRNDDGRITVADDVVTFEPESLLVSLTRGDNNRFRNNVRTAVDGAFKTPILRNVGTTPPYMHDGSLATLDQVIDFYNRGGNRLRTPDDDGPANDGFGDTIDTTGVPGGDPNNLDADIDVLHLTEAEQEDLKNFLLSLTDPRVLCHRAPFDHPELDIYNGHELLPSDERDAPRAQDIEPVLRAVGSRGYARNDCFPNNGNLFGEMQTKLDAVSD